jgi:hypothetical protein
LSNSDNNLVASNLILTVEMMISGGTPEAPEAPGLKLATMSMDSLSPNESKEQLVHHEIKDLTLHTMVCRVEYTEQDVEGGPTNDTGTHGSRSFQKIFKFNVRHSD